MPRFFKVLSGEFAAVWGFSLLIFGLVFFATNDYFGSDPKLTLLVSQAIVTDGTVRLDAYQEQIILNQPFTAYVAERNILEFKGHYYYYFPTGPAVVAAPFVWLARLRGWDMARAGGNYVLQRWLSALSVVMVFWLLYKMGRLYVSHRLSLVFSMVTVLGSGLVSTMGTALWSINFATVFMTVVLLWLARGPDSWGQFAPFGVGFLLFLAFYCRASAAAFVGPVLVYLWLKYRSVGWKTAVTAFIFLLLFLVWSQREFGQWLPAYFSAARLQVDRVDWWIGVYGNLLSPSRGVFVFSPFLALVIVGALVYWKSWGERPLIILVFSWFALLLLLIAKGASWWGGWSFGPRLLTEIMPGLALLTFLMGGLLIEKLPKQRLSIVFRLYLILGVLAIAVHSFQGLYNSYTRWWNDQIDPVPELAILGLGDLFNWQYTQILASPAWNCAINEDRVHTLMENLPLLLNYQWGQSIRYDNEQAVSFQVLAKRMAERGSAMEPVETSISHQIYLPVIHRTGVVALLTGLAKREYVSLSGRRTQCPQMAMLLKLDEPASASEKTYGLLLQIGSFHNQRVRLHVNGQYVSEQRIDRFLDVPETIIFEIPGTLWNLQGENEVVLELPDARLTRLTGSGYEGLVFMEATVYQLYSGAPMEKPVPSPAPAYP